MKIPGMPANEVMREPDGVRSNSMEDGKFGIEKVTAARISPQVEETLQKFITMDSAEFINQLEQKIANYFGPEATEDPLDTEGYISRECWKDLCASGIMLAFVPEEAGGRKDDQLEIESVLAKCANYSLPLSLMLGISGSLVVQIIQRFGTHEAFTAAGPNGETSMQQQYIDKMLTGSIGGLAVTEKGVSGSAITSMKSTYSQNEDGTYNLTTDPDHPKWWQGNSMGDFLVVIAKSADGKYGAFIAEGEDIVAERTETEGLNEVRYAENSIEAVIPANRYLGEIPDFAELFIRSRLQFIGMTHGEIQRLVGRSNDPEMQAIERASKSLFDYTSETINPSMESVMDFGLEASCIKALGAEWMHQLALMKRNAANDDNASDNKAVNDAFPFTRFEGPTQMLLSEISVGFVKGLTGDLRKAPVGTQFSFSPLTRDGYQKVQHLFVDLEVNSKSRPRMGKVIALLFALGKTSDSLAEQWLTAEISKSIVDIKAQSALDEQSVSAEDTEMVTTTLAGIEEGRNKNIVSGLFAYSQERMIGGKALMKKPLVKDELREALLLTAALSSATGLDESIQSLLENDLCYRLRLLERDHWASNSFEQGRGPEAKTLPLNPMPRDARIIAYKQWFDAVEDAGQKVVVGKLLNQAELEPLAQAA